MSHRVNPTLLREAQKHDVFQVLFLSCVCIAILFVQLVLGWQLPDRYLRATLKPVLSIPSGIIRWYEAWDKTMLSNQVLVSEIDYLEEQNLILSSRLDGLLSVSNENAELRKLLGVRALIKNFEAKIADVIAIDSDGLIRQVSIDLGMEDGVSIGQAVLNSNAIVGQVRRVGFGESQVILINDPSVSVPVYNARNGEHALLMGNQKMLKLSSADRSFDLLEGDILLTSGLGKTFPKGYHVGRVTQVRRERYLTEAVVVPLANLNALSRVFVLLGHTKKITESQ